MVELEDESKAAVPGDELGRTAEEIARDRQAEDNADLTDAPDPTGGKDDQMAAKQASTALGDQDAVNLGYQYPEGANLPTAQNVRRYPELFDQAVIDSFQVEDLNETDETDDTDETDIDTEPEQPDITTFTGQSTGAGQGDTSTTRVTF